jgi:O-antigen/teichoic acid export membrane protein
MSFGQGVLAARLLGVEGAGYVGIITQFSSNINRLISFRMSELVVSYVGKFSEEGRDRHAAAVFKAAGLVEFGGSLVAYLLIVLLAPLGAEIFAHNVDFVGLFSVYGLSVLANTFFESSTGLLQYFNRFKFLAFITVGQSVLTLLLIVRAFLRGGGLESVVIAYLAGKVVLAISTSIAALWQAWKAWGSNWWRTSLSLLSDDRRDLVRFAVSTNIAGTVKLITRDSEMLWLGAFSTPLQVGYYKIAKAITNFLAMPITPLITTTYREIVREVSGLRWKNVRYLLRSGTLLSAAYTIPAALVLFVFGQWIVGIYGPRFLPVSYNSLLILLIGVIPVNIFFWNQIVLLPLGMPQFPTQVHFLIAIVKVAGTLLLVPSLGANGMAMLLSIYFILTTGILVFKTMREIRIAEQSPSPAAGD